MNPKKQQIAILEKMGFKRDFAVGAKNYWCWARGNEVYRDCDIDLAKSETAIFTHLVPWMREQGFKLQFKTIDKENDFYCEVINVSGVKVAETLNQYLALAILECATKALGLLEE